MISLNGLPPEHPFPDPEQARSTRNGLIAIGGDLSPARLIQAYKQGIFPWYGQGDPILWWSPDPRTVLMPDKIHLSRRLKRTLKQAEFTLTIDHCFNAVTAACAAPRAKEKDTWLLPEMRRAYQDLHQTGVAHSFELWQQDTLVGGLYGVAIGKMFFGESMFSHVANASKIVMAYVCQFLQKHQFPLLDCQVYNPHLIRMGAQEIPRRQFLSSVQKATKIVQSAATWQTEPINCRHLVEPQEVGVIL